MKRLVQVWMVVAALFAGAQAAQAAPIAQFSWDESCEDPLDPVATRGECLFGFTDLKLTVLSNGTITNIAYEINGGTLDPQLPDPAVTLDGSNADQFDDQVNTLALFMPGEIDSVLVSFDHFDSNNAKQSFSRLFQAALLDIAPSAFPTFWTYSDVFSERVDGVPEPVSLSLLALGLATVVMRRRRH